MSWSIQVIGKPDKINERLQKFSESLRDQSKAEFDEAMPHLQALISQMVGENLLVKLDASGHASFSGKEKTYSQVSVSIGPFYSELAL